MAAIDYAELSIADTVTSGKGKSANISYAGQPVYWTPGGLQVAFEPGSFNGEPATRVNMQFRASAVEAALDKLDGWTGTHGDPQAEAQGPLAHGKGLRGPLGGHGPNV